MDAEKLELDQTFDTIVSFENIEHLGNPEMFLEKAKKNIKKRWAFDYFYPKCKICFN